MFFSYRQNNSGGVFDYDAKRGISVNVIVEADNYQEANDKAERIGLYFDGQGDCPCCGTRWCAASDYEKGDKVPSHYSDEIALNKPMPKSDWFKWVEGFEGFVHYKDGTIKGFWKTMEGAKPAKKKAVKKVAKKKVAKKKVAKKATKKR